MASDPREITDGYLVHQNAVNQRNGWEEPETRYGKRPDHR